uniref:C-type lectin domain-containing protein n=1 Tax=Salarias fasciatus TaxID=181472 RepID=A0A672FAU6_SALFA
MKTVLLLSLLLAAASAGQMIHGSWLHHSAWKKGQKGNSCSVLFMCRVESSVSDNCCSHVRREEDHRASVTDSFCLSAARSNSCPYSWSSYNSRCFKFFDTAMTWYNAEIHCYNLGGHLASVSNPREYGFVQSLAHSQTYVWLGGFRLQGRWIWLDGQGFYYTNWYSSVSNSGYDCMYLHNTYGWRNTGCTNSYSFICSMNPFGC